MLTPNEPIHELEASLFWNAVQDAIPGQQTRFKILLSLNPQFQITAKGIVSGLKGVPAAVNYLPGNIWVSKEHGLLLSLNPNDSIDQFMERPFSEMLVALFTGEVPKREGKTSEVAASLENVMCSYLIRHSEADQYLDLKLSRIDTCRNQRSISKMIAFLTDMQSDIETTKTSKNPLLDYMDEILRCYAFLCYFMIYILRKQQPDDTAYKLIVKDTIPATLAASIEHAGAGLQEKVLNLLLNEMVFHGPGNLSTFTGTAADSGNCGVVGTLIAGFAALSGTLHGGAAETAGRQLFEAFQSLGAEANKQQIHCYLENLHTSGKKIGAVGHRLLKNTDPRANGARSFIEEHFSDSKLVEFAFRYFDSALQFVNQKTNADSPVINVDAYTALMLAESGIIHKNNPEMAIAVFALARTAGILAQTFWRRALCPALIRPSAFNPWEN